MIISGFISYQVYEELFIKLIKILGIYLQNLNMEFIIFQKELLLSIIKY